MCSCGKSSCNNPMCCGKEATHTHNGTDIYVFCDLSDCLKKYGFKKRMNAEKAFEKMLELLDGQQKAIEKLKLEINQSNQQTNAPKIFYMFNGGVKPNGERRGDILIENSTGDAMGIDGKTYFWTGANWVKGS